MDGRVLASESLSRRDCLSLGTYNVPKTDGLKQENARKDDGNIYNDSQSQSTHINGTIGNCLRSTSISAERLHRE